MDIAILFNKEPLHLRSKHSVALCLLSAITVICKQSKYLNRVWRQHSLTEFFPS